jgi:hypothetical protein
MRRLMCGGTIGSKRLPGRFSPDNESDLPDPKGFLTESRTETRMKKGIVVVLLVS